MDKETQKRLENRLHELVCHTIPVILDSRMYELYRGLCKREGLAPDRQAARFIEAWVYDELKAKLIEQGIICVDSATAETALPVVYRNLREELFLEIEAGLEEPEELDAFETGKHTIVLMPSDSAIGCRVARGPVKTVKGFAWPFITWQDFMKTANAEWLLSWLRQ